MDPERHRVIAGDSELQSNTVVLKNLANGEQSSLPRADLIAHLQQLTRAN